MNRENPIQFLPHEINSAISITNDYFAMYLKIQSSITTLKNIEKEIEKEIKIIQNLNSKQEIQEARDKIIFLTQQMDEIELKINEYEKIFKEIGDMELHLYKEIANRLNLNESDIVKELYKYVLENKNKK